MRRQSTRVISGIFGLVLTCGCPLICGCMEIRSVHDDSDSLLEQETRRSTAPSSLPIPNGPPTDRVDTRQIPPSGGGSRGPLVLNGPSIETVPQPQAMYLVEARQQFEALARQMDLIHARANQKDAVGRAAVGPVLREFNESQQRFATALTEIRSATPEVWDELRPEADRELQYAAATVRKADIAVENVKFPP
jgi:hypothetical protein